MQSLLKLQVSMHKSKFTLTTWLARRLWANDFQGGMLFWPAQEAVIFVGILAQSDYIIYDLNRCFFGVSNGTVPRYCSYIYDIIQCCQAMCKSTWNYTFPLISNVWVPVFCVTTAREPMLVSLLLGTASENCVAWPAFFAQKDGAQIITAYPCRPA